MGHPYKCYGEIMTQAEAWQEAVDVVHAGAEEVKAFFNRTQPGEVIFAGCTSPYYAGIASAAYWQSALGIPSKAVPCSELTQFPSSFYSTRCGEPVMVVLSRSGITTETLMAVEAFEKQFPRRTLLIGCLPGCPLEKMASTSLMIPKGYENSVPQTRSFASMYLAALMIGAMLSGQEKTLQQLEQAPALVDSILQASEPVIARLFDQRWFQNIFYLGSGPLYGVAREATLKMMEMTISDTICVPFLESRHGPRSLIDEKTLVVGLYSRAGLGYEAVVMDELTEKHHATTAAIIPSPDWQTGQVSYSLPVGADWSDDILGLAYLPVTQLMAYYHALAKGVNPDTSRNLTTYIEIERL
jgi:glutamine---fructose-6-phosphate transaminase (isomerizing)